MNVPKEHLTLGVLSDLTRFIPSIDNIQFYVNPKSMGKLLDKLHCIEKAPISGVIVLEQPYIQENKLLEINHTRATIKVYDF